MMTRPRYRALVTVFFVLLAYFILFINEARAIESVIRLDTTKPQKISLMVGKSVVIESPVAIKRVSLAATAYADAIVLSTRQVYLTGKAPGLTNMTVWEGDNVLAAVDVEIFPDTVRLKERIHDLLPQENAIKVSTSHDAITLSGTVSNAASLSQVLAIAAPFGKVINLLEVGGIQQVMLEVRVSEMQKGLMRRLGFNFSYISASGKQIGLSLLDNLVRLPPQGYPANPLQVSDNINAIYQFASDGATWTAFVDALKGEGLLKVLAEPTLTTLSGQMASFNAGGEVPIPEASGLGTTSITYKKFGVGLNFTPTVMSDGKISMQVAPKVSELDYTNAVISNGFSVPAFAEREVSTVVQLADGQSFSIAGLLSENVTEQVNKFPILGDIPILGALFRSSQFKSNETELVVIVTPHLVKPLDMSAQSLPTDFYGDPGDFKFYLLGDLSGTPEAVPTNRKGFDGEVGHIIPK
jgi:pilus assembly protein CpaC